MSGIEKFRIALIKQLSNIPGWRTKKKIVIFESDDWGAIRTPSLEVFKKLSENNISVFDPFSNYDSLESQTDLEQLFNVLRSIKDINGHYPVFSANCVVSNPDFEKIAKSGFKEYHYEMVTETFKKYPNHKSSFKLWQEGLNEHIFYPQYHGREHINPSQWLKLLNAGNQAYRYAFMLNTYSVNSREEGSKRNNLLATLDFDNEYQKQQVQKALLEGLSIFNSLFGFKSNSFTPPCYIWDKETENLLAQNGIKFIKTSRTQSIPNPGGGDILRNIIIQEKKTLSINFIR